MTAPSRQEQALALHKAGRLDEAAAIYTELLLANPQNANAMQLLGLVALQQKDFQRAVDLIGAALTLKPDAAPFHHNIGAALRVLGRFDEAEEHYQTAIKLQPDYAEAYFNLAAVRKFTPQTSPHEAIEAHLARGGFSQDDRCFFHFAAGKMYDDLGEYDRAFEHYVRGNETKGIEFDCELYQQFVDQIIAICNQEMVNAYAGQGYDSPVPVFIVGMPRSGTTLLEQILASHPDVFGAGELPDIVSISQTMPQHAPGKPPYPQCLEPLPPNVFRGFGEAYVKRLRSLHVTASRIVDKLPRNFENLGLIARMLPGARIIHCRRNALDTCLSCYFQRFRNGQEWAYKLEDIAFYYQRYEQLMNHWRNALPLEFFDLDYETLVADQENESRRLIDFLGLKWDDRCLQFHQADRPVTTASNWQVRRPVYRSALQRWRRYEPYIAPLIDALGGDRS